MNVWDVVWKFAMDHYIFHCIALIIMLLLLFGKKYFRIRFGKEGLTVENAIQINPENPCPYLNPHPMSMAAINKNTEAIGELIKSLNELLAKTEKSQSDIAELCINDLRNSFWNTGQPLGERLKDGLEYVVIHHRNGDTKASVIKTAKENPGIYEGIIAGRKELKLDEIKNIGKL